MNRIEKKFSELKQKKRKALIPYITVGDPSAVMTVAIMQTLVDNGADILELGMPFSDPVADGVVIQTAHQRALNAGMTLNKLFEVVEEFRKRDQTTPVVLMSYINPIETMGYDNFILKLEKAGIDGVLLVDLPLQEGKSLVGNLKSKLISPIFLIAPTTSIERSKNIAKEASGFIYLISLKGVTGAHVLDVATIENQVNQIKQHTNIPIAIGFGIRDRESAAAIAKFADAIIVGSAYVALIEQNIHNESTMLSKIALLTEELRAAIDE